MIRRAPDLDDLDREIRDHIDEETQDNIARGMSEQDARAAAIRKFGNVTRVKEDVRGVWVPQWLEQLRQDARDAARYVRRNPGFSFAILITLTLGIGLTTAIYSVVNAVLIRPLRYEHPDRMVWLATVDRNNHEMMSSIDFGNWQSSASVAHMIAYDYVDSTVVAGGEASRLRIVQASDGFWEVTGAKPLLGTLPAATNPEVIVLTHRVFREQFNGDAKVIGRAVMVDGRQATIGAVLPDDFEPQLVTQQWRPGLDRVDAAAYRMMALTPPPKVFTPQTQVRLYQAIGEIKPGITIEQARAEIEANHAREQREHPTPFGSTAAVVVPLRDRIVGPSRRALAVLLSAAIIVLLMTCANVANLLLSRSAQRRKEIALRMSIGSGPLRVMRQLLAESLAYAVLGGVGGVVLASWLISIVVGLMGAAVPRLGETTLDLRVMAVAIVLSIGTALLFGVGPALALAFTRVQEVLKEGGRSVSASRRVLLTGRAMIGLQVALTVVLLTGAGLMAKSVWRMTSYPAGFAPGQILTMRMDFRGPQYRDQRARHDLAAALLARAKALPGVRSAALTSGGDSTTLILKEGDPMPPPPELRAIREAPSSSISADFGRLLGMSIVSGRWFEEIDTPNQVLINESLARRDFSDVDPIGARIRAFGPDSYGTIIGVVSDLKYTEIDADAKPEVFFHHADTFLFGITVIVQVDGDPMVAAPSIRKALSALDPTQTFYEVKTMEESLLQSIAPRRFNLLLLGTFALVALVLAVVGVYGLVAYAVAERTQEIGIRLALGAERARVVRMIVAQGMLSVVTGVIAGLAAAIAATRLIASLLYGIDPHDAATFAIATVLLSVIAFVACAAPAMRAAFVDPVIALRAE
ncbi:MAG: ABC transporter permease [Cyanobacteria bacterium]|nr:ABC transporter permease [Cyanobacteriota bacterium]